MKRTVYTYLYILYLSIFSLTVCADYNHVRSWSVTRFRGMINTQPGSVPLASFKVMAFEDMEPPVNYVAGNDFGKNTVVWRVEEW